MPEQNPQLLKERINQSVNVSAAFDNCFFHCYSLYLLANELPLPKELFTFQSLLGNGSQAMQLRTQFPNLKSLDVFTTYETLGKSNQVSRSPHNMVEKTLILGFLLREWFATQLLKDNENQDRMLEGDGNIIDSFIAYKEFRATSAKEDLFSGPEGSKYQSCEKFLEYFTARPIQGRNLTVEEQAFEKYFTEANTNPANNNENKKVTAALTLYWKKEGYATYCKYLAHPQVKLTHNDVIPVLKKLDQPCTIYDNHAHILNSHHSAKTIPPFEIALFPGEGHYHLLRTECSTPLVDEYKSSFEQYLLDRTALIEHNGDKARGMLSKESLLVGAICPNGSLDKTPFECLMSRITDIKQFVEENRESVESINSIEIYEPPLQPPPDDFINYNFLLKAGAYLSATVSLAGSIITLLALSAIITLTTTSVIAATSISLAAAAGAFGLFNASPKQEKEERFPNGEFTCQ